jgi:hypothetical protein
MIQTSRAVTVIDRTGGATCSATSTGRAVIVTRANVCGRRKPRCDKIDLLTPPPSANGAAIPQERNSWRSAEFDEALG